MEGSTGIVEVKKEKVDRRDSKEVKNSKTVSDSLTNNYKKNASKGNKKGSKRTISNE